MAEDPQIDVVIPVLNGARHIAAAARSALEQVGVEVRVTVVDGGSTDGTVDAVGSLADPRVTVIAGVGRLGIGAARNLGTARGRAPWISFLDGDDLWPRWRTIEMLSAAADPASDVVLGHMVTFDDRNPPDLSAEVDPGSTPFAPVPGNVLFSRELFDAVGELPEDVRVGEFIDWMDRARRLGVVERHCRTVGLYRRSHETNTTRTQTHAFEDYLTVVARARARRRSGGVEPLPSSDSVLASPQP